LNTLVNFRPAQPSKTDQFSAGANKLSSYLDKKTVQKSAVYEVIFRFDSNKQSDDILDCMTAFEQVASEFKIELKKSPDLIATLEQEKKIGLLLSPPSLKQLMTM
jgi:hypothetical protein